MSKAATTFSTTVEARTLAKAQEIAASRVQDFFAGVVDARIVAVRIDATYQPEGVTFLGSRAVKTGGTTLVDFEFTLVDTSEEEPAPPVDQPSGTCPMTDLVCTSGCQTACRRASQFRKGDIVEVVDTPFCMGVLDPNQRMYNLDPTVTVGAQGEVLMTADSDGDLHVRFPLADEYVNGTVLGLVRRAN